MFISTVEQFVCWWSGTYKPSIDKYLTKTIVTGWKHICKQNKLLWLCFSYRTIAFISNVTIHYGDNSGCDMTGSSHTMWVVSVKHEDNTGVVTKTVGIFRSIHCAECVGQCKYGIQWCHHECDGISNHQPDDCLLNGLFRCRSKKTSKLRVTGLCGGNSPVTGEFPAQMASSVENVSIWWRHSGKHCLKLLSWDFRCNLDVTNI